MDWYVKNCTALYIPYYILAYLRELPVTINIYVETLYESTKSQLLLKEIIFKPIKIKPQKVHSAWFPNPPRPLYLSAINILRPSPNQKPAPERSKPLREPQGRARESSRLPPIVFIQGRAIDRADGLSGPWGRVARARAPPGRSMFICLFERVMQCWPFRMKNLYSVFLERVALRRARSNFAYRFMPDRKT